jgi:hypothetical protein
MTNGVRPLRGRVVSDRARAASAVKAVAYLELYEQKALSTSIQTAQGRELLSRIIAMLNGF